MRRPRCRSTIALRTPSSTGSRSAAERLKEAAPTAPSTARWSQLIVTRSRLRVDESSPSTESVLSPTDGEDRGLGRIDDRRELVDPEHAEVGDRERRAGVLLRLELPLARELGELLALRARSRACACDRRRRSRARSSRLPWRRPCRGARDCTADAVAEPVRVDLGMLGERGRDRLHQDVVDRHLELVAHLEHRRAHLRHAREIEFGGEIEGRDRTDRLGETLGDRLANLRERDVLEVAVARRRAAARAPRQLPLPRWRGRLDVALDDAAARTGAPNWPRSSPLLASEPARERRRSDTAVAFRRGAGCAGGAGGCARGRRSAAARRVVFC